MLRAVLPSLLLTAIAATAPAVSAATLLSQNFDNGAGGFVDGPEGYDAGKYPAGLVNGAAPAGSVLFSNGGGTDAGRATVSTGVTTLPGEIYSLTVDVGNRLDSTLPAGDNNPTITLQLLEGTTVIGGYTGKLNALVPTDGQFARFTYDSVPATGGALLSVRLGADAIQAQFDNVTVTGVPEPTSLGLLGIGAVALGARRRRR